MLTAGILLARHQNHHGKLIADVRPFRAWMSLFSMSVIPLKLFLPQVPTLAVDRESSLQAPARPSFTAERERVMELWL